MMNSLRGLVLKLSYPVIKWVGALHVPYTKKKMKADHYYQILAAAKPGSILLSRTLGEATNLLIPGRYKHAAIVGATAGGGRPFVVEAVGAGVKQTDLLDFILSKDNLLLLEPQFASAEQMIAAVLWACKQVGKPYDYTFMSDYTSFYCCELTYAAYKEALDGKSPWELREYWGEPTVTPDDFLNATKKWIKILEF